MKKTWSEGAGTTEGALKQDSQLQTKAKQYRRRVSLNDEGSGGNHFDGKHQEMH